MSKGLRLFQLACRGKLQMQLGCVASSLVTSLG